MGDYDKWVESYSGQAPGSWPWDLGRPRDLLVSLIESGRVEGPALDLCCGAGSNTFFLASSGLDLTALDIAPGAVKLVKRRAAELGLSIKLLQASIVELPFCDGAFSFIHDFGCFHHVVEGDRTGFLAGLCRVLAPGGLYQLTCFSKKNGPGWNHFSEADIRERFNVGFSILEVAHYGSIENDNVERFFYTSLMRRL